MRSRTASATRSTAKSTSTCYPRTTIFTDEWPSYVGLSKRYTHRRIRHTENVYVSGDVHTQTIEGFFSNLKRGIAGNYHSVSSKWLQGLPERVRLALQRARQRAGYVPFAGRSCCRVLRRGIRTVDVAEGWDPRIIGL